MKRSIKTWLIASVSTSLGIALGLILAPSKKDEQCSSKSEDMKKIRNS